MYAWAFIAMWLLTALTHESLHSYQHPSHLRYAMKCPPCNTMKLANTMSHCHHTKFLQQCFHTWAEREFIKVTCLWSTLGSTPAWNWESKWESQDSWPCSRGKHIPPLFPHQQKVSLAGNWGRREYLDVPAVTNDTVQLILTARMVSISFSGFAWCKGIRLTQSLLQDMGCKERAHVDAWGIIQEWSDLVALSLQRIHLSLNSNSRD